MGRIYEALKQCLEEEELVALATVIGGPGIGKKLLMWPDRQRLGTLGSEELDTRVVERAAHLFVAQRSERTEFRVGEEAVEVLIEVFPPPPKLVIVGAVHIAIPLVTFARELGFRTIVVDARAAFATPERFPHAHQVIVAWPSEALQQIGLDESTYVVVLTHDDKLDNPALKVALESPARYVGALGSRKTHAQRVEALKAMGITDRQLARIHTPIGLDIGAQRPEEIAVAIMAEIVAARNGRYTIS